MRNWIESRPKIEQFAISRAYIRIRDPQKNDIFPIFDEGEEIDEQVFEFLSEVYDTYRIGTIWVNAKDDTYHILKEITNKGARWERCHSIQKSV